MQYIKDAPGKSKIVLYSLKNYYDEIVDVRREDEADAYYVYNGNIVSYDDIVKLVLDYWKRNSYKHQRNFTNDYGYEEVKKFIFRAGFKMSGTGGSWSGVDLIKLQDVNGTNNPINNEPSKYGITVGNMYEFFELAGNGGDFSVDTINNAVVLNGIWEFDCNKSVLCVKPYTGK